MSKAKMECHQETNISNLNITMERMSEDLREIKSDLKEHIKDESELIASIEKKIGDWIDRADKTYMKKETIYTILATITVLSTVAGTIYGLLKLLHPTL